MLSGASGVTPSSARTEAKLMTYNKSRDIDRVCPACLRWYRVGEEVFKEFSSFQAFLDRPILRRPEVGDEVGQEQDVKSNTCERLWANETLAIRYLFENMFQGDEWGQRGCFWEKRRPAF